MGGKSTEYTVGYWYRLFFHLIPCRGPIDELQEIKIGERTAWSGSHTGGTLSINAPELFGGESREGGIVGDMDVDMGAPSQPVNSYLAGVTGGPTPAHRGVVGLLFKGGRIAANNPYLKAPWLKLKRTVTGRDGGAIWYVAKANINGAMNAAHICYECLTNPEWGMGQPSTSIDETNFQAAADTLYTEGFGLNFHWNDGGDVQPFLQQVMDHINGRLGKDPATGLWTLDLIRDDYDPDTLPVLDESNFQLDSFDRPGYGELTNELFVEWTDPATGNPVLTPPAHNLAAINIQGGIVTDRRRYPGIGTDELANRVALRDLRTLSTPLARVAGTANRDAWDFKPADLVKLNWPPLGIQGLILRLGPIDRGTLTNGRIGLRAVEDAFGMPLAGYTAGEPLNWTNPLAVPQAVVHQLAIEVPYYQVARTLSAADLGALGAGYGFAALLAAEPQSIAYGFDLLSRPDPADYQDRGGAQFCPNATLTNALAGADSVLDYTSVQQLERVNLDTWAVIDDGTEQEIVAVRAIDTGAGTVTIDRGVLDTTPREFIAGARLWFAQEWLGIDPTEWVGGDDIDMKALTRTGLGTLAEASAPAERVSLDDRAERPYPPGQVRIEGQAWPATGSGDISISWAHRDRLQQTAELIDQDATDIGPEAGTTYTVRVYDDASGLLKHTAAGIIGVGYTYTQAQWLTDFGGAGPHSMRVEIDSQRGGLDSWQRQVRVLTVS